MHICMRYYRMRNIKSNIKMLTKTGYWFECPDAVKSKRRLGVVFPAIRRETFSGGGPEGGEKQYGPYGRRHWSVGRGHTSSIYLFIIIIITYLVIYFSLQLKKTINLMRGTLTATPPAPRLFPTSAILQNLNRNESAPSPCVASELSRVFFERNSRE